MSNKILVYLRPDNFFKFFIEKLNLCDILYSMNDISTNYNMPVPPEQVSGQSIAGPSVENTETQAQEASTTEQSNQAEAESYKGTQVDTSA